MATGSLLRDGSSRRRASRCAWLAALLVVFTLLPGAASAEHWAPPSTVFVPRTGHTTDGLFLDLWREQRSVIGDPVSEEVRAKTGLGADPDAEQIVQYYENVALVYLPEAAPGEQVRTLDLGRDALGQALANHPSLALRQAARRTACPAGSEGCRGFGLTGHTIGLQFRAFWEESGRETLLGLPVTEAFRAPDGSLVQYFERAALRWQAGREVEPLPIGVTTAKRLKVATEPIERPSEIPIYSADLFVAPPEPEPAPEVLVEPAAEALPEPALEPVVEAVPVEVIGPGPQQGGYQEIVVSISAQMMWAYENGQLVNSSLVSTGTAEVFETTTPIGSWSILSKVDVQDMEGTISGEYYFVEDVPYVMYFDNLGNALHGTYWHANFGAPMSHGCINLPMDVAAWMYSWAGVGTPVTVIG